MSGLHNAVFSNIYVCIDHNVTVQQYYSNVKVVKSQDVMTLKATPKGDPETRGYYVVIVVWQWRNDSVDIDANNESLTTEAKFHEVITGVIHT